MQKEDEAEKEKTNVFLDFSSGQQQATGQAANTVEPKAPIQPTFEVPEESSLKEIQVEASTAKIPTALEDHLK